MSDGLNTLKEISPIKTEPDEIFEIEDSIISKDFLANGYDDSDCEDMAFFTQVEIDNTRKCLINTRLIIKDIETQLDWHLQQYMTLRNVLPLKNTNPKVTEDIGDTVKRQDLLSISQLSAIISTYPEGNKSFIKRKKDRNNESGQQRKRSGSSYSGSSDDSGDKDMKDEFEEAMPNSIDLKAEMDTDDEGLRDIQQILEETTKQRPKLETVDLTMTQDVNKVKNENLDRDDLVHLLKSKAITSLDDLCADSEKAMVFLNEHNLGTFDFDACKIDSVVVTFEGDSLPEFVFTKNVADRILNDSVKLVEAKVFDKHLEIGDK